MRVQVIANFRVWAPVESGADKKIEYTKGMVIDQAPAGQSLEDWIAKGLVKAAQPARDGDKPAQEAGVAV